MTATFIKELAYLGQGATARLICAGKFLNDGKIAFVDRKNSVLLITDPSSETKQEIDLGKLLETVGVENLNSEDRPEPSDVNEAWNKDQLLITYTRKQSSLGIVCNVKFAGQSVSLQPPYFVLNFKERTRSIIAMNGSHFCARTENRIVILTMQGDVIANHPLRVKDRGGLLMTDRTGNLYFGDTDEFVGCTWDGERNIREMFRFTHPKMNFPRGSSFDGEGNIVVACDSSKNIFQLTGERNRLRILEIERRDQFGDIDFHQDGRTFFTTFWTENKWPWLYQLDL